MWVHSNNKKKIMKYRHPNLTESFTIIIPCDDCAKNAIFYCVYITSVCDFLGHKNISDSVKRNFIDEIDIRNDIFVVTFLGHCRLYTTVYMA